MSQEMIERLKNSSWIRLCLAVVTGALAWATGPYGVTGEHFDSGITAWILPGLFFGCLVLLHLWTSPGRAFVAIALGMLTSASALSTAIFGFSTGGVIFLPIAGLVGGAILGIGIPLLMKSQAHFQGFMVFCTASVLGSIPFMLYIIYHFKFTNLENKFFAPQWGIPLHVFWNICIVLALQYLEKAASQRRVQVN